MRAQLEHLMFTLLPLVIGQNSGQASNFQVSSRLTFKFHDRYMTVNVNCFAHRCTCTLHMANLKIHQSIPFNLLITGVFLFCRSGSLNSWQGREQVESGD